MIPAFLLPLGIEFACFWLETGDPLWRRLLSLNHVAIPSTELRGAIDRSAPPFFNPNYIANWRHEPGITLHWTIDGLANFLINSKAGITQWAAPLLLAVYGRKIATADRRAGWLALAAGLAISCGYIYALAIDPKARMLFPMIALTSIVLAMVLLRLGQSGHRLIGRVIVCIAVATAMFIVAIFQQGGRPNRSLDRGLRASPTGFPRSRIRGVIWRWWRPRSVCPRRVKPTPTCC